MAILDETLIQRAFGALGLRGETAVITESELIQDGQHIPHIQNVDPVLRIRVNSGPPTLKVGTRRGRNLFIHSWDLFHSTVSNQLIKAVSVWPKNVSGTQFPSISIQERQMRRIGHEFIGTPDSFPRIALLDAIHGAVGALGAKQIIAYYVMDSFVDLRNGAVMKPRPPVWVIHAWGIPPFTPHVPRGASAEAIPEEARNHLRSIICAETGKFYGADTIPQPL